MNSGTAPLARQFFNNDIDYQREVALYVLGWAGDESDISILGKHLLDEASSRLRITAASAHRQIHFRLPELKDKLLASLKQGFEKETDDEVDERTGRTDSGQSGTADVLQDDDDVERVVELLQEVCQKQRQRKAQDIREYLALGHRSLYTRCCHEYSFAACYGQSP